MHRNTIPCHGNHLWYSIIRTNRLDCLFSKLSLMKLNPVLPFLGYTQLTFSGVQQHYIAGDGIERFTVEGELNASQGLIQASPPKHVLLTVTAHQKCHYTMMGYLNKCWSVGLISCPVPIYLKHVMCTQLKKKNHGLYIPNCNTKLTISLYF